MSERRKDKKEFSLDIAFGCIAFLDNSLGVEIINV